MPILTRADLRRYLDADFKAYKIPNAKRWWPWFRFQYPILAWQRRLRRLEYIVNARAGLFWKPYVLWRRYRFRRMSIWLGFSIPPNVFGPGLVVVHYGTIVVHDKARVGANCRIHPGTCLAVKAGLAPKIGDSCYLGPGAKILGGVILGNGVVVGANAVVVRSFGNDAVLAGVPARDIHNPHRNSEEVTSS